MGAGNKKEKDQSMCPDPKTCRYHKDLCEKLSKLYDVFVGTTESVGFVTRMINVETAIQENKDAREEARRKWDKRMWALVLVLAAQIGQGVYLYLG